MKASLGSKTVPFTEANGCDAAGRETLVVCPDPLLTSIAQNAAQIIARGMKLFAITHSPKSRMTFSRTVSARKYSSAMARAALLWRS